MGIYKQVSTKQLDQRSVKAISETKKTKVRNIVSNFITHLKSSLE